MNDFLISHVEDEPQEQRVVWSTEKINQLHSALSEGNKIKVMLPFYEGNMKFRKANIVFDYTQEELDEIKKCAQDITYFAENYACVMTDNGIQRIHLRDYQIEMLKQFASNRFNITLASRQVGKCFAQSTNIIIKIEDIRILQKINSVLKSKYTIDSEIQLKFYELHYVLFHETYTILNYIKYNLYKTISYLT